MARQLTKSTKGFEVVIHLFNNGVDAGEYGYGFYPTYRKASAEMNSDVKKLIEDQQDADFLFGITHNPRYIKTIQLGKGKDLQKELANGFVIFDKFGGLKCLT